MTTPPELDPQGFLDALDVNRIQERLLLLNNEVRALKALLRAAVRRGRRPVPAPLRRAEGRTHAQ
jgi:hypothetical protein